jgi:hypothetical protein
MNYNDAIRKLSIQYRAAQAIYAFYRMAAEAAGEYDSRH